MVGCHFLTFDRESRIETDIAVTLQADFMFLFDNRFLLDFTPQELVRLLRALFADSPQRDAAVKRVLQGHPDAPADEDESS